MLLYPTLDEQSEVVILLETHRKIGIVRGGRAQESRGCSMGVQFQSCKMQSSEHLLNNIVPIVENLVREQISSPLN